jgi:uncharacterized membrane protein
MQYEIKKFLTLLLFMLVVATMLTVLLYGMSFLILLGVLGLSIGLFINYKEFSKIYDIVIKDLDYHLRTTRDA